MENQKNASLPARLLVSFLGLTMTNVGMAMTLGNNIVQPIYLKELTSAENMGLLFGAFGIMSTIIAFLYPLFRINVGKGWFTSGLKFGLPFGLMIFFCTHMAQLGYTTIPVTGWLLEGLYDSAGPMMAIIALAALTNFTNRQP